LVIADGLSALAIEKNTKPLLEELLPLIRQQNYSLAPVCIVTQGRVAIGDEIAFLLNSRMVVMLIGERPGLSSPDSLGIYLTYQPQIGLTDEKRNCLSNIRPGGLPYAFAAQKLIYLLNESFRRKLSGVQLKDDMDLRIMQ
jgi:ethanolamine ammonia-lyase small subunit